MRTTVTQRQDMVYFRRLCQPAFLSASFAEWMCSKEPGADPLPLAARVHPPCRLVAAVPVVLSVRQLLVFLAVPSLRQPGTAWVAARPLGFPWHPRHLQGIEKPPAASASEGSMFSFVSTLTISQVKSEINVKNSEKMCNSSKTFVTFFAFPLFLSIIFKNFFLPCQKVHRFHPVRKRTTHQKFPASIPSRKTVSDCQKKKCRKPSNHGLMSPFDSSILNFYYRDFLFFPYKS